MSRSPITRKEEAELPVFDSYKEAKSYFDGKYGKDFVLESIDDIDGQNCYFHALILDHATYDKGRRILQSGSYMTGQLSIDFLNSYQSIEIFEDGNIHIVY